MSEIRICEKREEKKDLVYLNLEADRKGIHLHIYLCVLLCCNLKIEQRKHLSAIGSPALLALCFHWPSPGAESLSNLSNLVWEDPLELMYSYLPLVWIEQVAQTQIQPGLSMSGKGGFLQPLPISDHLHGGFFFLFYLHEVSWPSNCVCCISSFPCEPLT